MISNFSMISKFSKLRWSKKLILLRFCSTNVPKPNNSNEISTVHSPKKQNGFKLFIKLIGATLVGAGGTIGYAYYDNKFRSNLENNIPYLSYALESILGKKSPDKENNNLYPVSDSLKPIITEKKETLKGSIEILPPKQDNADVVQKDTLPEVSTDKVQESTDSKIDKQTPTEVMVVSKRLKEKELTEAIENNALMVILNEALVEANDKVTNTVTGYQEAAKDTEDYSNLMKKAIENTDENPDTVEKNWVSVISKHDQQRNSYSKIEDFKNSSDSALEKLRTVIKDGRENVLTANNKSLTEAEFTLNSLTYKYKNALAEFARAESNVKLMSEYHDLVKQGREQFKKELESIKPEVKVGSRISGKMGEDELNALIAHAHRRIEQLSQRLAELQTLETTHISAAVERQRREDERLTEQTVKRELELQASNHQAEKKEWELEAEVRSEEELRRQLSRQAAAHSDHLTAVLKVQERDLKLQHDAITEQRIADERQRFQVEVAGHIARLKGIEVAVEGRADAETRARRAQQLWLACQALQSVVRDSAQLGDHRTWEEHCLRPLQPQIDAVRDAASVSAASPFVNTLLDGLSADAASRGVWTESSLTSRFKHVRQLCRRVAMVDEAGGTLARYALSYVQSLFVFRSPDLTSAGAASRSSLDQLDTFTIVDNAEYALQRGDLETAARLVNQLQGAPRRLARDWLHEARLLLEARQTSDALLARAAADGLGSLY